MNDTTSTPEDPGDPDREGRGAVVTGEQATASEPQQPGPAADDGAAGNGAAAPAGGSPRAGASPRPSPRPAVVPEPGTAGAPAAPAASSGAPAPAGGTGSEAAGPDPSAPVAGDARPGPVAPTASAGGEADEITTPSSGTAPTAPVRQPPGPAASTPTDGWSAGPPGDAEAPTARIRLPGAANGSAQRSPSGEARPAAPPRAAAPDPWAVPGARGPVPAPGPVPGPGPAAATPPPWHRVPGQESSAERTESAASAAVPAGAMGGLLDDGPTTYLESPQRPETAAGGAAPESGAWAGVRSTRTRPPRQAALQLKRLDPWSVLKLGLVLAVVLFFIWLVAVGVLYGVLDGMGVWDRLNGTYADLVAGEAPTGSPLISAGRVFGLAAVIGAINSLLFAVAVTVGAFVYNVSADLVGGIEVTLSERD